MRRLSPQTVTKDRVTKDAGTGNGNQQRSAVWLILALGGGVFFAGFDQTFVVAILPDMITDLGIELSQLGRAAWIVNGYLIGYTIAMPLMGRVADVYGHLRIYAAAVAVYLIGSLAVAAAPSLELLTLARVVQAIGGGAIVPVSIAIAIGRVNAWHIPLAIGVIAAMDDASSVLGPIYAGLLVDSLGWRGLFLLNIPLQLPLLVIVYYLARHHTTTRTAHVDWVGGLLLAAGLSALTVALMMETDSRNAVLTALALGGASIVLTIAFVWRQATFHSPLIQLTVLKARSAWSALVLYFADGAATITALVCIPLMTNAIWNGSPFDGAVNLTKMMIWMPVGGLAGGLLAQHIGYRLTAAISFVMYSVAFMMMWNWPIPPSNGLMWGTLLILGLAIGLNDAPILASLLSAARAADHATTAALTQSIQTIGMIVGMALLATRGLGRWEQRAGELFSEQGLSVPMADYQDAMHSTFSEIFLVAAIVSLLAVLLTTLLARGVASRRIWAKAEVLATTTDVDESVR